MANNNYISMSSKNSPVFKGNSNLKDLESFKDFTKVHAESNIDNNEN